jgi:hypothetical protein
LVSVLRALVAFRDIIMRGVLGGAVVLVTILVRNVLVVIVKITVISSVVRAAGFGLVEVVLVEVD